MGKDKIHKKKVVDESKGYIKLQRDIFEWCKDNISKGDRKEFSKREALIWLMIHTSYNGDYVDYKGELLDKGESSNSLDFLAYKFGWNDTRVLRFLRKLIKTDTIERIGDEGDEWKIRFINWEKYQESDKKSVPPSVPQSVPQSVPDNSLINIGVTDCSVPQSVPPSVPPSVNNTNNNDSSLRSSSYIIAENNNAKNNNNAASLRSAATAAAAESVVQEKDKGPVPSGQSGLYQPQPVQAPEFQMTKQTLSDNEENAFGIAEVFDRLKLYLPSGYKLDKNQQSFIRTEYFKVSRPNRRCGSFRKQNGDLWDLYGFTEWMAKLLREQGVPASDKPSVQTSSRASGTSGQSGCSAEDLKRMGWDIINF